MKMINEARQDGAKLESSCKALGITDRTYQRWINGDIIEDDKRACAERPDPSNKLTKEECNTVVRIANSPEYADLPPSQIVPKLADKGVYIASESTMYRILRKEGMQNHRGRSKKPSTTKAPDTHIASKANQVWSWDITYLNTSVRGQYYKLYMIMDIFSRKIVGWEVWPEENGEYAAELVQRTVIKEGTRMSPPVLHSDNGAPMKSVTLRTKLEALGVIASYSRPRVSNDNPYSEALFRTCKYRKDYPTEGFDSILKAREWVEGFVNWYNNVHYHSGINFVTPNSMHKGEVDKIMKKRKKVYNAAKLLNPSRWKRNIRSWEPVRKVALNPSHETEETVENTG